MRVILKSQWHLKDRDSKQVVHHINFNNNNLVMEVSVNLSLHISHRHYKQIKNLETPILVRPFTYNISRGRVIADDECNIPLITAN